METCASERPETAITLGHKNNILLDPEVVGTAVDLLFGVCVCACARRRSLACMRPNMTWNMKARGQGRTRKTARLLPFCETT